MLQLQPIFWHHEFGHEGALNDLNIWDWSQLHKSFIDGSFAKIDFDFEIDRKQFTNLYFFVDGIYPKLSCFVKTISVPVSFYESHFAKWQESVWIYQCGFGVLSKNSNLCKHQCGYIMLTTFSTSSNCVFVYIMQWL